MPSNPKGEAMRGLSVFISDIRACKSPKQMSVEIEVRGQIILFQMPVFVVIQALFQPKVILRKNWRFAVEWSWRKFTVILFILVYLLGKSREAERKRINKELANIRTKFKGRWNESTDSRSGRVFLYVKNYFSSYFCFPGVLVFL